MMALAMMGLAAPSLLTIMPLDCGVNIGFAATFLHAEPMMYSRRVMPL